MAHSVKNRIVINSTPFETRVALVRNGRLTELFIETEESRPLVGNIYKGRVTRVLPGMNAAFVDIGLGKGGFIHARDLVLPEYTDLDLEDEDQKQECNEREQSQEIADLLQEGQELVVQIVKPPRGTKGARVTAQLSLPGRNVVLVPGAPIVGVSRKMRNSKERKRLRQLVRGLLPDDAGLIVRTAAEGKSDDEIKGDVAYLIRLWSGIREKKERKRSPHLLYHDLNISMRTIRDLMSPDIEEIWVDDPDEFERVSRFVEQVLPGASGLVKLFEKDEPVFEGLGIEKEIMQGLHPRVELPSKGYLIIDETEALCAIDVNTGGFVGSSSLEETVLATNREAAREIAYQIRLRNLAGILVLDFIDMNDKTNRDEVFKLFKEALREDRARINITRISDLGLIEMTRQRIGPSLSAALSRGCPCCGGSGLILKTETVLGQLYRKVQIACRKHPNQRIVVQLHPNLADRIWETEIGWIQEMEERFGTRVLLKMDPSREEDRFTVRPASTDL